MLSKTAYRQQLIGTASLLQKESISPGHLHQSIRSFGFNQVLAYLTPPDKFPWEPQISDAICFLLKMEYSVYLPNWESSTSGVLRFFKIPAGANLSQGFKLKSGIPVPPADWSQLRLHESSRVLLLIPGLAFTCEGLRLGRGAGHYDKFIAGLGCSVLKIGMSHTGCLLEKFPFENEDHDAPVDFVLTAASFLSCRRSLH